MDPNKGARYCNSLENIVECPVCHRRLAGDVFLCSSGHSICRVCTYGLTMCTRCLKPCTAIPNLLARNLLSQLDEIKSCLMELDSLKIDSKDELLQGQYRCLIRDDCKVIGYAFEMIKHCRNIHPREFTEHLTGTLPCKQNWQMNYINDNLHRAFNIQEVGLFILLLWKTEHGELKGCTVMCAGFPMAAKHSYRIDIECDKKTLSYNGQVYSARKSRKRIFQIGHPGIFISRNEPLYHAIKEQLRFKCSIVINRENENTIDGIKPININNEGNQQGKRHRNRCRNRNRSREKNKHQSNIVPNKNNGQLNHLRTNNASNKQSTESKDLVQKNGQQCGAQKQFNELHEKLNNFSIPPEKTVEQLYPNDQLTQSTVHHSLGIFAPLLVKRGTIYEQNPYAHETLQTVNHDLNGTNMPGPSAKYEVQPPINPHFQHEMTRANTPNANSAFLNELNDTTENLKESVDVNEKNDHETFGVQNARYRCWINDDCRFTANVSTIIQHFRSAHIHQFEEHSSTGKLPYKKTWTIKYLADKNFDYAIKIDGLVFIVHIFITGTGELGACVVMYTSNAIVDQHLCRIEIECNQMKLHKSIKIISANSTWRVISRFKTNGFPIARHKFIYDELKKSVRFHCTVLMERKSERIVGEIEGIKSDKKKKLKIFSIKKRKMLMELKSLIMKRNLKQNSPRKEVKH